MTLAIILVVAAALGLIFILGVTVSRSLQINGPGRREIQPIDVEAFRNLVDPAEDAYLRRRLPAGEFRRVQRERLRATAAYIKVAGRNAAALALIGQGALASGNAATAEAARQLIDNASRLRLNASFALLRIYLALAWPNSSQTASGVLRGYERLNGSAMLLGRLQNPAVPVRIAANM